MKILLDTHVVLWAIADPARLSPRARILLLDDEYELLFSAASIWEIQLKRRAGKLTLPDDPSFLPGHLRRLGVRETIAVAPEHTYRVATLPLTHRGPSIFMPPLTPVPFLSDRLPPVVASVFQIFLAALD